MIWPVPFGDQRCSLCGERFPIAQLQPILSDGDRGILAGFDCGRCVEPDLSPEPRAML